MKNAIVLLAATMVFPIICNAQVGEEIITEDDRKKMQALAIAEGDSVYWDFGGTLGLNLNQSSFTNWAAGGQNAISTTAITSLYGKFNGKRVTWENNLDLAFGLLSQDGKPLIKTDDRIDFLSKYGYRFNNPNWYLSGLFNFRTQFRDGFVVEDGREIGDPISGWLSPAFSIMSLGMEYRPNKTLSVFLSPATAKLTVVQVERLRTLFGVDADKAARWEAGAYMRAEYRNDIVQNVNLLTRIDLFSNYFNNPQNIDVNWEVLLTFKVNEWLATSLTTQLLYDDDVNIGQQVDSEGLVIVQGGPRTQFRQVFAFGLTVKI